MGIAVTKPFYRLWSLPLPLLEFMMADRPITVYPKTDKMKTGDGKVRTFARPSQESLDSANRRWEERMRKKKNRTQPHNP